MVHPELGFKGDGDPLDVVEIGNEILEMGSVYKVKPIGTLAMIDDGEVDYKVIVIRDDDPAAAKIHTVGDIETHFKGTITGIREWFRWYKTPDKGVPQGKNTFGYDETILDTKQTSIIIEETHAAWQKLYNGDINNDKFWTKPSVKDMKPKLTLTNVTEKSKENGDITYNPRFSQQASEDLH